MRPSSEKSDPDVERSSVDAVDDRPGDTAHELELERIHTYRLQQQLTVGSSRSRTPRDRWLPMGAGKPYPPSLPESEGFVVEFEGADDPMHPQNWPMKKRYVNRQTPSAREEGIGGLIVEL
ncbi:uncharacterized protein LDX57_010909 [Aspergillus melleus]|uniref:uncharacterized protein n=1 Tax=Aspergillus melleus TaxID=138277 RepID=UPI001E8CE431|nr:uncharacterized protein LDX57_010909 [Aspergillus melleus]KAH8433274.1 hypothetical protein LDX57_010909 [Aspergillus melleus]